LGVLTIRTIEADQWQEWRAIRLAALTEAPYAFSSTLEDWSGTGDTEDRWRERLVSVPLNLIADQDGCAIGMASATDPADGEVEVISMWVAPVGRGSGVGDALVESITRWTADQGAGRLALAVRQANLRAVALYERQGFRDIGCVTAAGDPFPERRMMLTVL
jgi:ribosomal protein S18 acetylase RimI-like enzyme